MLSNHDRGVTLRSSPRKPKTTSISSSATVQPHDRCLGPNQNKSVQRASHSMDVVMNRAQVVRGRQRNCPAIYKLALIVSCAWFFVSFSSFKNQHAPPYHIEKTLPANFHRLRQRSKVDIPRRKLPLAVRIPHDDLSLVEQLIHSPSVTYPIYRGVAFTHYESTHFNPADPLPEEGCELLGEWQVSFYPTCSPMHEVDLTLPAFGLGHLSGTPKLDSKRVLGHGHYRDTWLIRSWDGEKVAVKTMRWRDREDDDRNYERHRRDAMAMEQLTASPHVIDIYGHCGNSVVVEYAENGGDLRDVLHSKNNMTQLELLELVHDLAASVADAHHLTNDGYATIAHTDLYPNNWNLVKGKYKLNDFNRAKFLTKKANEEENCPFFFGYYNGPWRSPEEYQLGPQTSKIDVYSLGNVLHYLLVPFEGEYWPGSHVREKDLQKQVAGGKPVTIDDTIRKSANPYTKAMVKAIDLALEPDPRKRATAQEVHNVLKAALSRARSDTKHKS